MCIRDRLYRLDAQVEAEQADRELTAGQAHLGERERERQPVPESEQRRHHGFARGEQRPDRVQRPDQDAAGDERFDRPHRDVDPAQRGRRQRDRVPGGEREGHGRDATDGAARSGVFSPAAVAGPQRHRQEQDQQEQQMVGAFQDVVAAEPEHRQEPAPQAAAAQVDGQVGNGHRPGVERDHPGLCRGRGEASGRPVLTDRDQHGVRHHLVDDGVVAEPEAPDVSAGRGCERRGDEQLTVRPGLGLLGGGQADRADHGFPGAAFDRTRMEVSREIVAHAFGGSRVDAAGQHEVVVRRHLQGRGHGRSVHVEDDDAVRHRMRGRRRRPGKERRQCDHREKQTATDHEKVNSPP